MSSWRSGPENKDGICCEECRCIPFDKPGEVWSESKQRRCESVRRHAHLLSTCLTPAAQFQGRIAPRFFDLCELSSCFFFFWLYPLFLIPDRALWRLTPVNSLPSLPLCHFFHHVWLPVGEGPNVYTNSVIHSCYFEGKHEVSAWRSNTCQVKFELLLVVCVCVCVWPALCLVALPLPLTSLKHCI